MSSGEGFYQVLDCQAHFDGAAPAAELVAPEATKEAHLVRDMYQNTNDMRRGLLLILDHDFCLDRFSLYVLVKSVLGQKQISFDLAPVARHGLAYH